MTEPSLIQQISTADGDSEFERGTSTEPFRLAQEAAGVTPVHKSIEGQDMVTDEELLEFFKSDEDERLFYELMVRDYERILFTEDAEGLANFEREVIHFMGRFVPHFDPNGDGVDLLNSLRRDIDRSVALAGDSRVKRVRYAYAVYYDYASGKRRFRELVIGGYLSEFLPIFQLRGGGQQRLPQRRGSRAALPRPTGDVIRRWTVTPPGVTRLGAGQIRLFTGQSRATLQAMIRTGLQPRAPAHPGRAHYGRGVYTSQQRPIAESYAAQHEEGVVAQATPKVTNFKVLNVTAGAGADAFETYLSSIPGLRQAWRIQENRYHIFEAFIQNYAPDIDIVIAPHGAGNQFIFRSPKALEALQLSVPR